MNLIVAVDKNWAIGYEGDLLVKIPEDLMFFKEKTTGKAIIMGRKTLESMPGGKPLPNRFNIVISNQKNYKVEGAVVVHSLEEALQAVSGYKEEEIFIIGGETIYRQMLTGCKVAYVTKIDNAYQADAFFPCLDELEEWKLVEVTEGAEEQELKYQFCTYERQ